MADDSAEKRGPALPPKLSIPRPTPKPAPAAEPETSGQPVPVAKPIGSPQPVLRPTVGSEAGTIKLKPVIRPNIQPLPQPPLGGSMMDNGKESTMRITLPESGGPKPAATPQSQIPTIRQGPPTKMISRAGVVAASAASAGASTPVIQSSPAAPASPASKKETSRIPLEAASASPVGGVTAAEGPKTIRITPKPAAGPATIKLKPQPAGAPKLGSAATQDEKKKTSRIPLDAALVSDAAAAADAGSAEGPKTIRLKRPGAAPALKVGAPDDGERIGLGATSKIEETAKIDAEEPPTPTRRKTIKVKRPGQQPVVKTAPAVGVAAGPAAVQPVVEDQPSWFFPVVTVLAIFVVIATIYVFAAEAIGPNPSLTQLSYYVEGPDLGMPMKIQPPRQ